MAKEKLITNPQIKKAIKDYESSAFIELILELAQSCTQAREVLTLKFTENRNDILEKYKRRIKYEFFPQRGIGRLYLREAKEAISDFKNVCTDTNMVIDLMLFYVENCVAFTNKYGDIYEAFYISAENMYCQVLEEVNKSRLVAYEIFADRLGAVVNDTANIGWGFHDSLKDMYDAFIG